MRRRLEIGQAIIASCQLAAATHSPPRVACVGWQRKATELSHTSASTTGPSPSAYDVLRGTPPWHGIPVAVRYPLDSGLRKELVSCGLRTYVQCVIGMEDEAATLGGTQILTYLD